MLEKIFKICFLLLGLFINISAKASIWDDFSSPIYNENSQKILLVGTGAVLSTLLLKKTNLQKDLSHDQPLCCKLTDPGNKFLQIVPNIFYAIGFGLDSLFNHDSESERRAIGMVKATAYSDLIVEILKPTIGETRPNGEGRSSFPSGHATSAFAFASFVASEHPWYVGVPAYAMASYVGFCRMQDNHHYLHDVVAGATIGISYGIAISDKSKKEDESKSALIVLPTDELKGLAMRFTLQY